MVKFCFYYYYFLYLNFLDFHIYYFSHVSAFGLFVTSFIHIHIHLFDSSLIYLYSKLWSCAFVYVFENNLKLKNKMKTIEISRFTQKKLHVLVSNNLDEQLLMRSVAFSNRLFVFDWYLYTIVTGVNSYCWIQQNLTKMKNFLKFYKYYINSI